MNLNSGVGDNAAGRYFGGMGGRGSGMNSRQMRQYMQMRRDEMSHGAFLANQNSALDFGRQQTGEVDKFYRESSRIDSTVQQQDWSRGRASEHLTGFGKSNPHAESADLDSAKASWNPAFAPPPPKRGGTSGPRMTVKKIQAMVDSGELSQAEAAGRHSNYAARVGRDRADDNAGKTPAPIRQGVEYVAGVGSPKQFGGGGASGGGGVGTPIK
jgi:hypothetical protein